MVSGCFLTNSIGVELSSNLMKVELSSHKSVHDNELLVDFCCNQIMRVANEFLLAGSELLVRLFALIAISIIVGFALFVVWKCSKSFCSFGALILFFALVFIGRKWSRRNGLAISFASEKKD